MSSTTIYKIIRTFRRSLRNDKKGVALVVTAFVLIGIVLAALALVRVTYVPSKAKSLEVNHYREVMNQLMEVKSLIDVLMSSRSSSVTFYWPVKLGYTQNLILGMDIVQASLGYDDRGLSYAISYGYLFNDSGVWVFSRVYDSPRVSGGILYKGLYQYYGTIELYYSGGVLYLNHNNRYYTVLALPIRFDASVTQDGTRVIGLYAQMPAIFPGSGMHTSVSGMGSATLKITCREVQPPYSPPKVGEPSIVIIKIESWEDRYLDYAKAFLVELENILLQMNYTKVKTNATTLEDAINEFGVNITGNTFERYMILFDEETKTYYIIIGGIDYLRFQYGDFTVNVQIAPSTT
ncbi:MAG: hypothetical protein J7K58_03450 [Euryarchaeota archaeon]|nr:hypothetical protein [Euryarchaeota archaeon]